ncbi:hypothetical protein BC332_24021 [Capsicum chinense]|nr:hypothetical protein BC332_24021 [Capsicum chinense]
MELFGVTSIRRKIILEGRLVVVIDGSGSGAVVGDNDAPLTVFETKSHYDYDHTGCTNFFPAFSTSCECSTFKYKDYKVKHDGVINVVNALTASVKKITSKRVESTTEDHNITVDNSSTPSKEEEKVEPVSSGEWKNYLFKRFNILKEAPKKLTQLINDYSEWIDDMLLKHNVGSIIKGFSISAGLPWHLVDEVYIPINCGDEFPWVLAVVILKYRGIRVYDSMSRRRCFGPSSETEKLAKILPTYLDKMGFLDQKVHTDWSMIEAY